MLLFYYLNLPTKGPIVMYVDDDDDDDQVVNCPGKGQRSKVKESEKVE